MAKRVIGLDLIRVLATIFVLCVHFYLNSNFYSIELEGWKICIAVIFRWLFFICVPLFIILTGYLKANKELSKEHYKSIIPIIASYLFIAIVTSIFRSTYLGVEKNLVAWIIDIINFGSVGYGWYLEMYIGLFLLIPFLNILYKNLTSYKQKLILIGSLLLITSLPSLTNQLHIQGVSLNIFPDWWINLYPFVYYFIGCFIKDISSNKNIKIKIPNKKVLFRAFIIILVIEGVLSFLYATTISGKFNKHFLGGYYSIVTVILSTIFFLLLYDINIKNKKLSKIISFISLLSLDIYLFSYIGDLFVYNYFKENVAFGRELIYYAPLCVFLSFTIAFTLSLIKHYIFKLHNFIQTRIRKALN